MRFSRAISWVKWLIGKKANVSKTISVLVLRVLVFSPFKHLTRLITWENFITVRRRESDRSYKPKVHFLGHKGPPLVESGILTMKINIHSKFSINLRMILGIWIFWIMNFIMSLEFCIFSTLFRSSVVFTAHGVPGCYVCEVTDTVAHSSDGRLASV
jgi:hypothetical protein